MPDINFDQLSERFKKNIYGSTKGQIRLEVLWRDINDAVDSLHTDNKLNILDAGCGMGQISARLAEQGHHLFLNDISGDMLQSACELFAEKDIKHHYEVLHKPLQELTKNYPGYFDLVMNHAVLEWTEHPQQVVQELVSLVKPGGYLSLMFYNIHSLVFRNLVRGNLYKVERGDWAGTGKGSLTPINPLEPNDVYFWLEKLDIEVVLRSGIRVFQDYLLRHIRDEVSDEDIVKTEVEFSRKEPYLHMGRYIHLVCVKT